MKIPLTFCLLSFLILSNSNLAQISNDYSLNKILENEKLKKVELLRISNINYEGNRYYVFNENNVISLYLWEDGVLLKKENTFFSERDSIMVNDFRQKIKITENYSKTIGCVSCTSVIYLYVKKRFLRRRIVILKQKTLIPKYY